MHLACCNENTDEGTNGRDYDPPIEVSLLSNLELVTRLHVKGVH